MSLHIINIFESVVTLSLFYIFYMVFLRKETFFKLNRAYLITTLIFSVTIPFINLEFGTFPDSYSANNVANTLSSIRQDYFQLNEVVIYASGAKPIWEIILNYIGLVYFTGVVISFLFFTVGFIQILLLVRKSTPKKYGRYKIIESTKILIPFSLFRWIIINPDKHSSDDMEQIIAHERMHAFQLHSVDLIIIEVLVILFWFNPFIYWYRKSIREVHEYLADQAVVENGYDRIDYQKLLLNQCVGNRYIGLTSRFSYSLSKNRLKMLTMIKSKNTSKTKIALIIPFVTAAIFFFACQDEETNESADKLNLPSNETSISKDESAEIISETEEKDTLVYFKVEVMPKFQGEESDKFRYYIQENLKYPEEAQRNNEEGRVYVMFTVDNNGYVKDIEIARGVSESLDQEAVRVVESSPKWEPGLNQGKPVNVRYTFPIVFKLN